MKMNKFKKFSIFLLIIIMLLPCTLAFARAGGGGGGGGGSSSHSSSSGGGSRGATSNPLALIPMGLFLAMSYYTKIGKHTIAINKRKKKTLKEIKNLESNNSMWDYYSIEEQIEEAFFIIQEAWTTRDYSKAKAYMSSELYDIHNTKISWMKIRGERNVLKNIKIFSIKPIKALVSSDGSTNEIWVSIRAKMKDYIENENTHEILQGSIIKEPVFEEYWRFILENNKWVADKIIQIDEVELDYFDKLKIK